MVNIEEKTCTLCGIKKPLIEFNLNSGFKDGRLNVCKPCDRAKHKKRRIERGEFQDRKGRIAAERASGKWVCNKCGIEKPLTTEFYKPTKKSSFGFTRVCRSCANAQERARSGRTPRIDLSNPPAERACKECGETKPYTFEFFGSVGNGKLHARCRECTRAAKKKWDTENAQHRSEYYRAHRGLDPFTHRIKKTLTRRERQERHRARVLRYKKKNPEVAAACAHNLRAKQMGVPGRLTGKELRELMVSQGGCCPYCQRSLEGIKRHLEHIIPLDRAELSPTNDLSNVIWACARCNLDKCDKTPEEWVNRWYHSPTLLALEAGQEMVGQGELLQ